MTRATPFDLILAAIAVGAVLVAASRTTHAPLVAPLTAAEAPAHAAARPTVRPRLQDRRRTRSLFRITVAGRAEASPSTSVAQPARNVPSLEVRAIVGGPPWNALVTGWPGAASPRVVRTGDRVDSLVVVAIEAERVRFAWADSMWAVSLPSARR